MHHIKFSLPNTLDPFAYRPNRFTDDEISTTLHLALSHLEQKDSYVRLLFINFSSAFNTIPQQLIHKLNLLGLNTSLCNWILDFLTRRPQSVRFGRNTSSTTTLSTGAPQGCVLSPLLFTLLTHDCTAKFSSNHINKFADDTTVVGLISNNDETHYSEEVAQLAKLCGANNLSLNLNCGESAALNSWGCKLQEDFTLTTNITSLNKKGQQHLYFLCRLKRTSLPPPILTTFYRGTIESVLTSCITVWYGNCSAADRKTLQWTVNTAAKIIGAPLPSILDIFLARCSSKASSIVKDPSHNLFQLLPSGRRYQSIKACSARLLNSFFPQAVRAHNSNLPHCGCSGDIQVETFKFLGFTISQDLKWDTHIDSIVKKAQQRLHFLRQLMKFNLPQASSLLLLTETLNALRTGLESESLVLIKHEYKPGSAPNELPLKTQCLHVIREI
ncbi:hypothetical protein H4Q32_031264 [Labeo rohita]|uniref:Reverse transcriptase domain-containing protein n=1 Tax=Labeo rohita TaxID=84645 RepID=A0ABQ8LAN7_LABRO|nr:hypothetical protein H4Q32_031264 [Labeo rohita]